MKIIAKTVSNKTINLEVEDDITIGGIKDKLTAEHNYIRDNLRVIFRGKILADELILQANGITEGETIIIMESRRGKNIPTEKKEEPVVVTEPVVEPAQNVENSEESETEEQGNVTNGMMGNPQLFMQMLLSNPQIATIAQNNPQMFAQVLSDPNFMSNVLNIGSHMEGAGTYDDGENDHNFIRQTVIQLTDDEMRDVEELTGLGCTQDEAVQAYIACDKNKDLAANLILDRTLNGVDD